MKKRAQHHGYLHAGVCHELSTQLAACWLSEHGQDWRATVSFGDGEDLGLTASISNRHQNRHQTIRENFQIA